MPCLESLSSPQALDEFSKAVAKEAAALRGCGADVNVGITTTDDLNAHLVKGRDVPFNYQRLVNESYAYN